MLAVAGRILQPLVVHGEALHQVLGQARRGPLAELGAAVAADAVADGEDGFEVVVVDVAGDLAGALLANYPEIPDSCSAVELALVVDVDKVFVDGADVFVNSSAIWAWESQIVSSSKRHSMRVRPSSVW